ncbi:MAG: hypothetical protein WBO73_01165 [Gammaproteobacteria bacterium]|jgi:hypothetical protein
MHFFKNKHLVLAMFVAPVLAIIAYFAVDAVVSEKPRLAQEGNSYRLAANPNCRYQSGRCTLRNGDVEVNVNVERVTDSVIELTVRSNLPAQHVIASFVGEDTDEQPAVMQSFVPQKTIWSATFALVDPEKNFLRLALKLSGSVFYAELPAVFIDYNTSFSRDNFSN